MGCPTEVRNALRKAYAAAFSWEQKGDEPTVAIVDFMMFIKVISDKDVVTKDHALGYFVNKIRKLMLAPQTKLRVVVVLVDTTPPAVKRMVEHAERYKNKNVYDERKGPYLPRKGTDLIPTDWIRFAGNYHLLQRELYPELFNAFMSCRFFTPNPGQMLVLSGFPGRTKFEYVSNPSWETTLNADNHVLRVQLWTPSELPITERDELDDPDLYKRVFILEHVPPCQEFPTGLIRHDEWIAAKNDICEADLRMFYFEQWYQNEHVLFMLNDGDVFSIGLLYAYERAFALTPDGEYKFRNRNTVCLPYKRTEGNEFFPNGKIPYQEFVDLNIFYQEVMNDVRFKSVGVQNPVAATVFLIIMAGTDFFQDHLKGIGTQKVVWKVFFENVELFTHLVMLTSGVPRETRRRVPIVIDEDLFRQYIFLCYIEKHEKPLLKKLKCSKINYDQLLRKTKYDAKGQLKEDTAYHLPNRNKIRLWCRQVEWNLDYWKNGPLGHVPDPFEIWDGAPYYPYWKNPTNPHDFCMVEVVASRPKPVDEVYKQHLYATRVLKKRKVEQKKE